MAAQQRSVPAVLGLVLAIVGFFVRPVLGFFLGIGAVLFGVIGLLLSASPRKKGGLASVAAVVLGVVGIIFQIVRGVFGLLF